jgi:hypothetical protein
MALIHEYQDNEEKSFPCTENIEQPEDLEKRKRVRRLLEARLEQRSLKRELEDYEGELEDKFDWGNL